MTMAILGTLLLAGCGGLSTDDATRLVEAAPQFRELPKAELIDGIATRGGISLYAGLVDLGLVAIHPGPAARVTASGKERFKPFRSAPEPYGRYVIPLATGRRILHVSLANHTRSQAEAEVRWRYDLTDIGRSVANRDPTDQHRLKGEQVYRATFTKYDDGWRLEAFAPK
jgi:hypothetical protein